jgi:hypothetical protein
MGSSADGESAIGNTPALVPGPLARLLVLQLLTELSPQVTMDIVDEVIAGLQRSRCR